MSEEELRAENIRAYEEIAMLRGLLDALGETVVKLIELHQAERRVLMRESQRLMEMLLSAKPRIES